MEDALEEDVVCMICTEGTCRFISFIAGVVVGHAFAYGMYG